MSQYQTTKNSSNGSSRRPKPEPEVVPDAKRRRFSVAEKRRILEEADACNEPAR